MKKYDIVSLGEILIDFVPDGFDDTGDEKFLCKAGGAPLNVLATAAKYGMKTAFVGKVGNDIFGKKLIGVLKDNEIDCDSLAVDEVHNTTLAFVKLDGNGDRDFSFYRDFGADVFLTENEVDAGKIKSAKVFHFGSLSSTAEPVKSATNFALDTARSAGCIISYDPNYRPPLWKCEADALNAMRENLKYADIVKLSREEALMIADTDDVPKAIEKIKSFGVTAVAVTDGDGDVFFSTGNEINSLPSVKVKAVDTTGAGDIFFGTLLTEFISDGAQLGELTIDKLNKYVSAAIEVSAESVTKKGAISSIPLRKNK